MAQLTPDQVRHIAKLARLRLSDAEVEKFTTELTSILGYIDVLQEVKTDDVAPTAQVTGLENVFRLDALRVRPLADNDKLLETSALPVIDHQIQTPSAHG